MLQMGDLFINGYDNREHHHSNNAEIVLNWIQHDERHTVPYVSVQNKSDKIGNTLLKNLGFTICGENI